MIARCQSWLPRRDGGRGCGEVHGGILNDNEVSNSKGAGTGRLRASLAALPKAPEGFGGVRLMDRCAARGQVRLLSGRAGQG